MAVEKILLWRGGERTIRILNNSKYIYIHTFICKFLQRLTAEKYKGRQQTFSTSMDHFDIVN